MASAASNTCAECGAAVPSGGSCRDHLNTLLSLVSQIPGAMNGWPGFYAFAAYGLQHPDDLCAPAQAQADLGASVIDALAGRVTLDGARRRVGGGGAQAGRGKRGSAEAAARRRVEKWPVTIADVCAGGVEGLAERVERWAQSVVESLDAAAAEPGAAADQSPENQSADGPPRAHGITIRDSAEPVNSDQLDGIIRSLNLRLPAEYRSFLLRTNGGVPEPRSFHYIAIDEDEGTRRRQKGKIAQFYSASRAEARSAEARSAEARSGQVHSLVTVYQNSTYFDFPWLLPIAEVEDAMEGGFLCIAVEGENEGRICYWPEQEMGEETLHWVADSFNSFLALLENRKA